MAGVAVQRGHAAEGGAHAVIFSRDRRGESQAVVVSDRKFPAGERHASFCDGPSA